MTSLVLYASLALGVSFFCSLAEAALLSMTPFYVHSAVREDRRFADFLRYLGNNMDHALAAILSLNTIAHTVGAVGVGASAAAIFGSAWVGVASAVMTVLILVLSEIIPKTLGATSWRTLAPILAPAVWALVKVLWPLVWVSERLTALFARGKPLGTFRREELAAMAELGFEEGVLASEELGMVKNLVRFHTIRADSVMTPRTVVFALDEALTVRETMERFPDIPYSRIPLYGRSRDDVTGILLKADLYLASARDRHDVELSELRRPVEAVAPSLSLMALFKLLLDSGQHLALVVDEYGGLAGLVTLEDAIETLLGLEIVDELDTTADLQELARDLWRQRAAKLGVAVASSHELPTATPVEDVDKGSDPKREA
jgi:CBS domain containing-hemolysin-like protein